MSPAFFAPQLCLKNVKSGMDFYESAFDAVELRSWRNDDGSVHVAEMEIAGAMFHLHEEVARSRQLSPETLNGITVLLGLFVSNTHVVVSQAVKAGAIIVNPVQDYDYGYRQGIVRDPFGHQWLIQEKLVS